MDTFFTKIKANKPTLYLQVLAFLILIGGYHVLYGLVNENQSVVQAFNNYAKNLLLVNTIGAFFTFGAMNYFGFFGKKARTLAWKLHENHKPIVFDYKKYQMRAANAATNKEKLAINQELKDLYSTFSADKKKAFDLGLEKFLKQENEKLKADYEAIKRVNMN